MRKILLLILMLLLVSCNGQTNTNSSFVVLTDPNSDKGMNEYLTSILENEENITLIVPEDEKEYKKSFNDLVSKGTSVIISTNAIAEYALKANLKSTNVVLLNNYADTNYLNEYILQYTFKTNNAGFLAGIAASYYALSNGTRQVGYIITDDSLLAGFEDGLWQEYPECTLYIGSTLDGHSVSDIIDEMVLNGVQIIFSNTQNGDTSVVDEIARRANDTTLFTLTYDRYPRNIGNYFKTISDTSGEKVVDNQVDIRNCIYFRIYDDIAFAINNIVDNYIAGESINSMNINPYTAFITEVLNNSENINLESLEEKISTYKELLNSGEIIVRTMPSNANSESRIKIVE